MCLQQCLARYFRLYLGSAGMFAKGCAYRRVYDYAWRYVYDGVEGCDVGTIVDFEINVTCNGGLETHVPFGFVVILPEGSREEKSDENVQVASDRDHLVSPSSMSAHQNDLMAAWQVPIHCLADSQMERGALASSIQTLVAETDQTITGYRHHIHGLNAHRQTLRTELDSCNIAHHHDTFAITTLRADKTLLEETQSSLVLRTTQLGREVDRLEYAQLDIHGALNISRDRVARLSQSNTELRADSIKCAATIRRLDNTLYESDRARHEHMEGVDAEMLQLRASNTRLLEERDALSDMHLACSQEAEVNDAETQRLRTENAYLQEKVSFGSVAFRRLVCLKEEIVHDNNELRQSLTVLQIDADAAIAHFQSLETALEVERATHETWKRESIAQLHEYSEGVVSTFERAEGELLRLDRRNAVLEDTNTQLQLSAAESARIHEIAMDTNEREKLAAAQKDHEQTLEIDRLRQKNEELSQQCSSLDDQLNTNSGMNMRVADRLTDIGASITIMGAGIRFSTTTMDINKRKRDTSP